MVPRRRLLASLASAVLVLGELDGWPWPLEVPRTAGPVLIQLPADVEQLRSESPAAASAWRMAVRDALEPLLQAGRQTTGVTRDGCLVVGA